MGIQLRAQNKEKNRPSLFQETVVCLRLDNRRRPPYDALCADRRMADMADFRLAQPGVIAWHAATGRGLRSIALAISGSSNCDGLDLPQRGAYNGLMQTTAVTTIMQELLEPVGQCLTPEVARRIANLRASARLQSRVDELADKATAGTLTEPDRLEYEQYVRFAQFITLLQIQARKLLDSTPGSA